MLLDSLKELHGRLGSALPPHHHKPRPLAWLIALDARGDFRGWLDLRTGPKGAGVRENLPVSSRTSGVQAHLFVDKSDYVLGLEIKKGKAPAAKPDHAAAFLQVARDFAATAHGTPQEAAQAVVAFLAGPQRAAAAAALPPDLLSEHWIGFEVDLAGAPVVPHRLPDAQQGWIDASNASLTAAASRHMPCALCGDDAPALPMHPVDIRINGDASPLISANANAFESYGLSRSEICPMCINCALRYGEALNYVLSESPWSYRGPGGVLYGFWTRDPSKGFNLLGLLDQPQPEDVKALLSAPLRSREPAEVDEEAFYALGVTSNKRMVVRDWITSTLPEVQDNVRAWFARQHLRAAHGAWSEPAGLYPLAASLVLDANKLSPRVLPALFRAALLGLPVPFDFVAQVLRRARAEKSNPITVPRAKLLRMALNDHFRRLNPHQEEPRVSAELNPHETDPGYLCGRLFATLEAAQYAALGSTNTTVADRFFGTASSAPASVFGRLMKGSQAHLQKVRKQRPGLHVLLQRQLEEILGGLQTFPRTLSLESQGLFALGYYHQRADDARRRAESKAQRAAAGQPADPDDDDHDDTANA